MSCARSSNGAGAGAGDPSSGLGSSSSTCSLKSELEKGSRITGGWTELSTGESRKATRGSGVATEGICASYRKRSKTEEEDREARKGESSTKERCSQKTTLQEI